MKNVAKALYDFWSGFGIPAYVQDDIPSDAVLPYITYELRQPDWRGTTAYRASVWYADTSYVAITEMCDNIANEIGEGKRIPCDGGNIWLFKEDDFCQFSPFERVDEDVAMSLKHAYLSMIMHVIA